MIYFWPFLNRGLNSGSAVGVGGVDVSFFTSTCYLIISLSEPPSLFFSALRLNTNVLLQVQSAYYHVDCSLPWWDQTLVIYAGEQIYIGICFMVSGGCIELALILTANREVSGGTIGFCTASLHTDLSCCVFKILD